jgi:hypothetical protein
MTMGVRQGFGDHTDYLEEIEGLNRGIQVCGGWKYPMKDKEGGVE